MTVKERIILFIKHKNVSIRAFEMNCGLANATISNINDSISSNTLGKISNIYPELNKSWLLTGEGFMLKSDTPINNGDINSETLITQLRDEIEQLKKQLDAQQQTIDKLFEANNGLINLVMGTHESKKQ